MAEPPRRNQPDQPDWGASGGLRRGDVRRSPLPPNARAATASRTVGAGAARSRAEADDGGRPGPVQGNGGAGRMAVRSGRRFVTTLDRRVAQVAATSGATFDRARTDRDVRHIWRGAAAGVAAVAALMVVCGVPMALIAIAQSSSALPVHAGRLAARAALLSMGVDVSMFTGVLGISPLLMVLLWLRILDRAAAWALWPVDPAVLGGAPDRGGRRRVALGMLGATALGTIALEITARPDVGGLWWALGGVALVTATAAVVLARRLVLAGDLPAAARHQWYGVRDEPLVWRAVHVLGRAWRVAVSSLAAAWLCGALYLGYLSFAQRGLYVEALDAIGATDPASGITITLAVVAYAANLVLYMVVGLLGGVVSLGAGMTWGMHGFADGLLVPPIPAWALFAVEPPVAVGAAVGALAVIAAVVASADHRPGRRRSTWRTAVVRVAVVAAGMGVGAVLLALLAALGSGTTPIHGVGLIGLHGAAAAEVWLRTVGLGALAATVVVLGIEAVRRSTGAVRARRRSGGADATGVTEAWSDSEVDDATGDPAPESVDVPLGGTGSGPHTSGAHGAPDAAPDDETERAAPLRRWRPRRAARRARADVAVDIPLDGDAEDAAPGGTTPAAAAPGRLSGADDAVPRSRPSGLLPPVDAESDIPVGVHGFGPEPSSEPTAEERLPFVATRLQGGWIGVQLPQ